MNKFPDDINFCFPWRSYQGEVLNNLDEHLANRHLHLVAPPGSGKTVLGLEVMRRLNKATLIIAPTIAIRNQWADRFTELFLQKKERPNWISTDIKNPSFLTITTYQGIFALFHKMEHGAEEPELDDLEEEEIYIEDQSKYESINRLFQQNFQTLILDEAHHLRTSWWKTTIHLRDQLENPAIVALTATPPYDVGKTEWENYIALCGPIDEEIEIAALVKEGDLCPHQDYVWVSSLTKKEKEPIDTFHQQVSQFQEKLMQNQSLQALMEHHPWMNYGEHLEEKLANYPYFISMILYLRAVDSAYWEKPFLVMEEKVEKLPSFDRHWLEELLSNLLYKDKYVNPKEEPLKSIKKQLSHIGSIEHRKIKLHATRAMQRTLLHSASKLDSIVEIVQLEKQSQKKNLRMVILADYIYQDDLPKANEEAQPLIRLGVIPIFEKLRRQLDTSSKLGVLTGSVVIIPNETIHLLEEASLDFSVKQLDHDPHYALISWKGSSRQKMVKVMTDIFSNGDIDVLIGTTALLGEGWDAPSVNTLILASYVGSFMLTNQMRGRALRTENGNEEKVANIWHLVCVDRGISDGGYDFQSLTRRFDSLTGVDAEIAVIQSGIQRLRMLAPPFRQQDIHETNKLMKNRATNRSRLFAKWREAVAKGEKKRIEMGVSQKNLPPLFMFRNTLKSLIIMSVVILASAFVEMGEYGYYTSSLEEIIVTLCIGFLLGLLFSAPYWWKALRIYIFNSSLESRMKQLAETIYLTLYDIGLLHTSLDRNKIIINKGDDGSLSCYLEQGTTYEQKVFIDALQELLDPIDNPRYLLHRQSGKRLWVRHDYHAVPEEIGRKKEYVEKLLARWNKQIGSAKMIYTRTPEGRRLLLKARLKAMSSKFVKRSERKSIWS